MEKQPKTMTPAVVQLVERWMNANHRSVEFRQDGSILFKRLVFGEARGCRFKELATCPVCPQDLTGDLVKDERMVHEKCVVVVRGDACYQPRLTFWKRAKMAIRYFKVHTGDFHKRQMT